MYLIIISVLTEINKSQFLSLLTSLSYLLKQLVWITFFLLWSFLHLHLLFCSHIWIRSLIQSLASQKIELMHDIICRWIWRSLQLKRSFSFRNKIIADHAENQITKTLIKSVSFTIINSSTSWLLTLTNSLILKKARQKKHNFWSKSWSETNQTRNC